MFVARERTREDRPSAIPKGKTVNGSHAGVHLRKKCFLSPFLLPLPHTKTCVILAPPRGKLVTGAPRTIARFFRSWPLDTAITMRQTRDKTLSPDFLFPVDREGEGGRERELSAFEYTRGTNDKRGKGMTTPRSRRISPLFLRSLACLHCEKPVVSSSSPSPPNRISIWGM